MIVEKNMSDGFRALLNAFLKTHPEHIAGHRKIPELGTASEDVLDSAAVRAFMVWAVRTRGADPGKVRGLWRVRQGRFPDQFVGELDV
jgi:hypothetical protein